MYPSLDIPYNLLFLSTCWNFHLFSSIPFEQVLSSGFSSTREPSFLRVPAHDENDADDADDDSDASVLSLLSHEQTSGWCKVRNSRKVQS